MDLCCQSNVSAFEYAIEVGHNFPSEEQASFNVTAAITICSDFGAPEIKSDTVSTVSPQCQTFFGGAPKSLQMVTAAMKLKDAYSLEEKL